jgi:hypothetical protein
MSLRLSLDSWHWRLVLVYVLLITCGYMCQVLARGLGLGAWSSSPKILIKLMAFEPQNFDKINKDL